MELTIRITDDAGSDLYRWFADDSELQGRATIAPVGAATDGAMGFGFDVLNLVIPNVISLASLVVSIASFRDARRRSTGDSPDIQVGHAGFFVAVNGDGSHALQQLTQAIEGAPGTPAPAPAPSADGAGP